MTATTATTAVAASSSLASARNRSDDGRLVVGTPPALLQQPTRLLLAVILLLGSILLVCPLWSSFFQCLFAGCPAFRARDYVDFCLSRLQSFNVVFHSSLQLRLVTKSGCFSSVVVSVCCLGVRVFSIWSGTSRSFWLLRVSRPAMTPASQQQRECETTEILHNIIFVVPIVCLVLN